MKRGKKKRAKDKRQQEQAPGVCKKCGALIEVPFELYGLFELKCCHSCSDKDH